MNLDKGVFYKIEKDSCPICEMMTPLFDDFVKSNKSVVGQVIDAVSEEALCEKYGIVNLPTFMFIDNKDQVQMLSGLNDKKDFNKFTKQYLKTL